jgi:hypothetical protein
LLGEDILSSGKKKQEFAAPLLPFRLLRCAGDKRRKRKGLSNRCCYLLSLSIIDFIFWDFYYDGHGGEGDRR